MLTGSVSKEGQDISHRADQFWQFGLLLTFGMILASRGKDEPSTHVNRALRDVSAGMIDHVLFNLLVRGCGDPSDVHTHTHSY